MTVIKKNEREYLVKELAHEWKLERNVGGVRVSYLVSKKDAPDLAALERFIMDDEEL